MWRSCSLIQSSSDRVAGTMSRLSARLICALCTIVICSSAQELERETRIVQTAQGPVKGYKDPQDELFTFFGIPYATAPTGADRFKAPLPGPSWLTTLDADSDNIICPQATIPENKGFYANLTMREDCLFAYVYVPNTIEKNLPVMVVVHGGAFQLGSGNILKPKKFVKNNKVIVVTFNYRLGIHGFLCLGTEGAPGNAGMKDQVALLRWVNKNIANFGGNPDDVTISGYSAGSSSVDLLMLSPLTKGLFNKVIAESGGSLAVYAVQTDPLENAKVFARRFNIEHVDDVYALEEFYKTASFETITSDAFLDTKDSQFYFSPCLETDVGQEIFLSESPYKTLKSGQYEKVPILLGFADREGLLRMPLFETWKNDMNEKFSDFLPRDLKFKNKEEKEKVAKEVKQFYFGDKKVGEDTVLAYIDFFSDVFFTYSILKSIQFHEKAGHNKVFLYEYNYVDELTPAIPHTELKGANHCAQTFAVYDTTKLSLEDLTEEELPERFKKHKNIVRQIWGNFVKIGMPVPEGSPLPAWPPVDSQASPHMELGRELQLRGPLLQERMRFWDNIYEKHYRIPQSPHPFAYISHEDL